VLTSVALVVECLLEIADKRCGFIFCEATFPSEGHGIAIFDRGITSELNLLMDG
jgi:hypothetical protein